MVIANSVVVAYDKKFPGKVVDVIGNMNIVKEEWASRLPRCV